MLNFRDVQPRTESRETRIPTRYGAFYARYWEGPVGWMGFVDYHIGDDVYIHRCSPFTPRFAAESDIATWVQAAFDHGPRFIAPMLEDV